MLIKPYRQERPENSVDLEWCADLELSGSDNGRRWSERSAQVLAKFVDSMIDLSFVNIDDMDSPIWSNWISERTGGVLDFLKCK